MTHPPSSSFDTASIESGLQQIAQLGQAGNLTEATARCKHLLQQFPETARAWDMLGLIALQAGKPQEALSYLERAITLDSTQASFHDHAGVVHCSLENFETGIACYQKALALNPKAIHVRYNLGLALQKLGRSDEALQTYRQVIEQQPQHPVAHYQIGNLLQQQQQYEAAIEHYQQAIQQRPEYAEAWYNLGVARQQTGEHSQALNAYQQALRFKPQYAEALNGLGTLLDKQEKVAEALHCYQQALTLQPNYLHALTNLGNLQIRLDRLPEAETTCRRALELDSQLVPALDNLVKIHLQRCHWSELAALTAQLQTIAQDRFSQGLPCEISPLNSLFLPFSATQQQAIARSHAQAIARRMGTGEQEARGKRQKAEGRGQEATPSTHPPIHLSAPISSSPIRLGYVSGDFRYHAVGHLIFRLFELHDRAQFQVFAYSLGPDDGSAERQKLMADCDCFRDIRSLTPTEAAQQIIQDQIHILIDLSGYTDYACPEIFALRPAPVQINYLGYPGTLGSEAIDYIITDPVITPAELAESLTEACLYLPDSYQLNSYQQYELAGRGQRAESRRQDIFTFCCFNKSQKIEPRIFATWMRILRQVPNSVLWLLSDRSDAEANLKQQAQVQGIGPERIVFVPRVPKAEHLARHAEVDLFLDTLYYNAHVTASDALWAGVPVLTVLGDTFASRVAASLLTAIGLPELITHSLEEYEHLAIHLATHPEALQHVNTNLADRRYQFPLFDTARTVRHLEAGYRQIWQRHQSGQSPDTIWVEKSNTGLTQTSRLPPLTPQLWGELDRKSPKLGGFRGQGLKSYSKNIPSEHPSPENLSKAQQSAQTTTKTQNPKPKLSPPTAPQKQAPPPPTLHPSIPQPTQTLLTCTIDEGFGNWLSQINGSLAITTYQAGKVMLVGWDGQQVTMLPREFPRPMGIAVAGDRLALATQEEVLLFANAAALVPGYLPDRTNRYDALYLPRATYATGDLQIHDLAYGDDGLWMVNTRFSCLAQLSPEFSFVPRWQPAFISELAPDDRCHLNGLAMVEGKPKYVTALGATDTPRGWRENKATGGILIEVETQEIRLQGLSMPHSPRWYQGRLWLLNSGSGELWQVDPQTWQHQAICTLPGFGRGLCFVGNYALVGLSQMRDPQMGEGLAIQQQFDRLCCGVVIVDLQQGEPIGWLEFTGGCHELYDVAFFSGSRHPALLTSDKAIVQQAISTPEFGYWLRPIPQT